MPLLTSPEPRNVKMEKPCQTLQEIKTVPADVRNNLYSHYVIEVEGQVEAETISVKKEKRELSQRFIYNPAYHVTLR